MTVSTVSSRELNLQRYLSECERAAGDVGPGGAFRPPDPAGRSPVANAEYSAGDCLDAEMLTFRIHGPRRALLRQFALCGFGAPIGVFPGVDRLDAVLAERIVSSWLDAASQFVRVEDVDLDTSFSFRWHCAFETSGAVVHGSVSRHELVNPVAGLNEDGLPVLRDGAPVLPDGSKDYKNPAWLAHNRALLHLHRASGTSLPLTPENALEGNSGASNVRALRAAYREALAPASGVDSGPASRSASRTPARGSSNGNSLTVTPSHSGTNCPDFGL